MIDYIYQDRTSSEQASLDAACRRFSRVFPEMIIMERFRKWKVSGNIFETRQLHKALSILFDYQTLVVHSVYNGLTIFVKETQGAYK